MPVIVILYKELRMSPFSPDCIEPQSCQVPLVFLRQNGTAWI